MNLPTDCEPKREETSHLEEESLFEKMDKQVNEMFETFGEVFNPKHFQMMKYNDEKNFNPDFKK
jgi:hypothetical protein